MPLFSHLLPRAAFVAALTHLAACTTQPPLPGSPAFSAERLEFLVSSFEADVARGDITGFVIGIGHEGEPVFTRSVGARTVSGVPMRDDTLFRIASMTKPVTAVAILTLLERGLLGLDDPVSDYIPEIGTMQVRQPDGTLRPPSRPIRIVDLFTHTAGIGYRFDEASELGRLYREAAPYQNARSLEEAVSIIAGLPLYFDPGERFFYSYGIDILGRIVEVVSGEPFGAYLERFVFEPLGMDDTGFFVTAPDEDRLAEVVMPGPGGHLVRQPGDVFGNPLDPSVWPSGGAGLISTAHDYLRFAMMLDRGGTLDGVQILSPASVALMTANHLPEKIRTRLDGTPLSGIGLGLAVAVVEDIGKTGKLGAPGDFTWGGYYDTQFFVSPRYDVAAVLMVQREKAPGEPDRDTGERFKTLVLGALRPNGSEE